MPRRTLTYAEWLERLDEHALSRGGRLLSPEYLGTQTKHWWQCRDGHAFDSIPANVLRGSWCPFCAGNARVSIDTLHAVADGHGGELLSYRGQMNRHVVPLYRCAVGHEFELPFRNYQARGSNWCLVCEAAARRLRMITRLEHAAARAGYILVEPPADFRRNKARFQCPDGHDWWCRDWQFRIAEDRCLECWRLNHPWRWPS